MYCLLKLRFYSPVNPMGSCQARSVCLTTLLLGRLILLVINQYCTHSFAGNSADIQTLHVLSLFFFSTLHLEASLEFRLIKGLQK